MKNKIICIAIIFLFLSGSLMIVNAKRINSNVGRTIHVNQNGDGDYKSIQTAINFARHGDIIYVHSGTYEENLKIQKSITLIGENKATTFIDPPKGIIVYGIFISNTKDVIISGFTIEKNNCANSISVSNTPDCTIKDCIFNKKMGKDIKIIDSPRTTIKNNIIKGSRNSNSGIIIYPVSTNTLVMDNTINNGNIVLFHNDDNIIKHNTIYSNYEVMILDNSNNNKIYNNNFLITSVIQYQPIDFNGKNKNNRWDNGKTSGGNYWSNYRGAVDNNNDGIADNPFKLDSDNIDKYPWMEKNGKAKEKTKNGDLINNLISRIFRNFPNLFYFLEC